jgi:hypothetical protein
MKEIVFRKSLTAAGFVAGLIGLAVALSGFTGGCGDAATSGSGAAGGATTGTAGGGAGVGVALPEIPPIDLLAPTSFETAFFALG